MKPTPAALFTTSENGPRRRFCGLITIAPVASENSVRASFAAMVEPSCNCKGHGNPTGTITLPSRSIGLVEVVAPNREYNWPFGRDRGDELPQERATTGLPSASIKLTR